MPSNGEEKTRLVRRGESPSKHIVDSDIHRESGSTSGTIGTQSIRTDRDNGSSGTGDTDRRKEVTGEIVSHLISECRNQVATKKYEIENLEIKIQEFETLLEDIEQSTEEEPE